MWCVARSRDADGVKVLLTGAQQFGLGVEAVRSARTGRAISDPPQRTGTATSSPEEAGADSLH
jgi:hypothetical protein